MTSHTFRFSCVYVLTIFTFFHCSLCIEYEKTALLEFKKDLIDDANLLSSWNSSNGDCCKWYGITCNNQTGRVTEIRLRGPDDMADFDNQEASVQKLGGKLNPSLRNLTSLEYLDLSSNDFGGNPIPTYIGSLRNLTYLNLSDSSFSGEIPTQLGNLSALRVLSVHRNLYSDDQYELRVESLRWLSGVSRLRHLDLSGVEVGQVFDWSQVTRTLLPSSLEQLHLSNCGLPPITPNLTINLSSLSVLDLSFNNFSTNSIPSWISSFRSLVSLNLANCEFKGSVPPGLMNINSLTTLDLSNNQLTSIQTTPETICNLREINLSWNKFDGKNLSEVLSSWFQCESSKLESLRFVGSGLSGNLPPQLGNLKNLVHIDLNKNSISGSIPDSLGNLSSLQTLQLAFNSISGTLPDSIGRLTTLVTMYLSSNLISGPLPDSLGRLSSLADLDLSYNEINGTLPQSIGQLTNLTSLNIEHNFLRGVVTEDHFANLTSLITLRASANTLRFELLDNNWEPPFQLQILNFNSWSLGPNFPHWLQNQTDLLILYLASTGISDDIPSWFWNSFSGLQYLNISDNNFSSMSVDDFFCSNEEQKQVIYLNMGNANISGVLPDCFSTWEFLNIFSIQNNNLSGKLPISLANLSSLESLNMRNNKLSGELPVNLMNSKSLLIIDLTENEFTGSIPIPIPIGDEATTLRLLNLRSNRFDGEIPDEICRIDSIQILDLADNNLSGRIPNCFNNFSVMTGKVEPSQMVGLARDEFRGNAWLMMKGRVNGYGSILGLVTILDLSGNDLSGDIPIEITQLVELRSLNLSVNGLTGKIPVNMGDMKMLEALDLSRNRIDGIVPLSMSRLSFLNSLNLSYNELTGRIPLSGQLQTFEEWSFVGNGLCGPPVRLMCERQGEGEGDAGEEEEEEEGDGGSDGPEWGLITSIVVGFVVGFWVVVGPLIGSNSWRTKYFEFLYDIWCKFCVCMPKKKNSSNKRFHR